MAAVYHNLAQIYLFDKEEYDIAKTYAERALRIKIDAYGPDNPRLISAYALCVRVFSSEGDFSSAQQYAEIAEKVSMMQNDRYPDSPSLYGDIGLMYKKMKDYPRAITYLNRALEGLRDLLLLETGDAAQCYMNLGGVYAAMGDAQAAYDTYAKVSEIYANLVGATPEQLQEVLDKLPALIEEEIKASSS
jgi:tetratricopeptide (TPR) repeat protein